MSRWRLVALVLLAFLAAPLAAILLKSVQDSQQHWVGLKNFVDYARTPALLRIAVEQPVGVGAGHARHRARGLRLRLCADTQPHGASSGCNAASR